MTDTDPFALFQKWYDEARTSEINDSNAMALATADATGQPAVRMVLLKGYDAQGFVFYTNDQSGKGQQIAANPKVALLFHWKSLRRQIRISGPVSTVSDAVADAYFATRARDSQLGAWASNQSQPLADRQHFEDRFADFEAKFADQAVPRPPHWNGHLVTPTKIEFWEDREYRLHHRRLFTRAQSGWTEEYLYP